MRKLVEVRTKHVGALKNWDFPIEGLSEMILVNIASKHLNRESRKLSLIREELPMLGDLMDFIRERSRIPESAATVAVCSEIETTESVCSNDQGNM